jgi:hypothetical protein
VQAVLDRLQSIDRATAGAQTALDQLKADLTASPPVTFEYRQQQIAKCLDSLNEFDNDDQWKVNYFNQIYYSNPWSGTIAPAPDATGLAFSTIFILPVFLRTIIQFLTVGIAFEPNFATAYGDPIRRFAGRLQTCTKPPGKAS